MRGADAPCTMSLPWKPEHTSTRRLVILYLVHAWRASDAVKGITPTTVKSDRPGMTVSVMEGGPSQKVCSGTIIDVGEGPFTFSFGCFDFFGLAFEGFGLYAQQTSEAMRGAAVAAWRRAGSVELPEIPKADAALMTAASTRKRKRLRASTSG